MSKIHIINQYIWPDGSPICLVCEQITEHLTNQNVDVTMVGGGGEYRPSSRSKPDIDFVNLQTKGFERDTYLKILLEYFFVFKTVWQYVRENVNNGDTLVITNAPFLNILLRYAVLRRKVKTLFIMFDYFPASIVSLNVSGFIYKLIKKWWDNELSKFNYVIKVSSNVGYYGPNSVIKRLWPMINIEPNPSLIPSKMALYTGNLGITHDVPSLVEECFKLQEAGYQVNFHADGPGLEKLPDSLKASSKGVFKDTPSLIKALYDHEIHLITGTVGTDESSFPSKIWNSLASGRKVIACGFTGKMKEEFDFIMASDYKVHLPDLANFIRDKSTNN